MINWPENTCKRTSLLIDRAVLLSTEKNLRILGFSVVHWQNQWKSRKRMDGENRLVCKIIPMSRIGSNGRGADGVRVVLQTLVEIQNMMAEIKCELEQFPGRTIFMSMYNDIAWREKRNEESCIAKSQTVAEYAGRFAHGHWSFPGLGAEKKWYGTHTYKPNGIVSLRTWWSTSVTADIPYSVESSALERGALRSKGKVNIVHTFLWWRRYSRSCFSHNYFSQSAPYLRSQ